MSAETSGSRSSNGSPDPSSSRTLDPEEVKRRLSEIRQEGANAASTIQWFNSQRLNSRLQTLGFPPSSPHARASNEQTNNSSTHSTSNGTTPSDSQSSGNVGGTPERGSLASKGGAGMSSDLKTRRLPSQPIFITKRGDDPESNSTSNPNGPTSSSSSSGSHTSNHHVHKPGLHGRGAATLPVSLDRVGGLGEGNDTGTGSPTPISRGRRMSVSDDIHRYISNQKTVTTLKQHLREKQNTTRVDKSQKMIFLPRGGTYVSTAVGPIQFGCPPETIKDSMANGLELPMYFVIPNERFDMASGINVAEFEFPAYFNFFVRKRKINLILSKANEETIRTIFKLTLLGPDDVPMPTHFSSSVPREAYPDLNKEMSYFRVNPFDGSPLTVDTILEFTFFDENNEVRLRGKEGQDVVIKANDDHYVIEDQGHELRVEQWVSISPYHPVLIKQKEERERKERERANDSNAPRKSGSAIPGLSPVNEASPASGEDESKGNNNDTSTSTSTSTTTTTTTTSSSTSTSSSLGVAAPLPASVSSTLSHLARRRFSVASSAPPQIGGEGQREERKFFTPPHFGVTMLGVSDGFDAGGTTTGMVIWMNRRGLMVDPPPHSTVLLQSYSINPRLIKGVILTHCHADHDAGTFQKILEEGRVVLITTQVIKDCFIKKYSAISGLKPSLLDKLFVFREAIVGERTSVYGGYIDFFYALHSIPCVGFSAHCGDKSMIYSADTHNHEPGIRKLLERGLMTKERYDKLCNFPWDKHDLILHEAGVPPIHTPFETLMALPQHIKDRLRVVHTNPGKFPEEAKAAGLRMCEVDLDNPIIINDKPQPNATALEVLDLVGSFEWFADFPIHRAVEMVQAARSFKYKEGEVIIEEGSVGDDRFYFISMGIVNVSIGKKHIREMYVGDHFGERSMVLGGARTATISARTAVELIAFDKYDFHHLVRDTKALEQLRKLAQLPLEESWQALMQNQVLLKMTASQKNLFLSMLGPKRKVTAGETLWRANDTDDAIGPVLIMDGTFAFAGAPDDPFRRGDLVGEMKAVLSGEPFKTTFGALTDGHVFTISRNNLIKFCELNPGFHVLCLGHIFF